MTPIVQIFQTVVRVQGPGSRKRLFSPLIWIISALLLQGIPVKGIAQSYPNSTIALTKNNATANGSDKDVVTVQVLDAGNGAVVGQDVNFTVVGPNGTFGTVVNSVTGGYAVLNLTNIVAGAYTVYATIDGVAVNGSPMVVNFVPGTAVPVTPPGVTNGTNLSIKLDGQAVDGPLGDSVKAHITDINGNPVVPGTLVTFTITAGGTISSGVATLQGGVQTVTVPSGPNGDVVIGVNSTMAGTVKVAASIVYGGVPTAIYQSPQTVTFKSGSPVPVTPPGVSGTILSVKLDNQQVDGSQADSVRAHITDIYGNPVAAGTMVTFTILPGGTVTAGVATLQGGVQTLTVPVTGTNGDAVIGIRSTMPGTVIVNAAIIYNGVATTINQSPQTVTFVTGTPIPVTPPGVSGTVLTIKLNYQPVDGSQGDSVKAYITDIYGNPAPAGTPVTFTITTGGTITAGVAKLQNGGQTITVTTGAGGSVVVGINSTMAGTVAVGATIIYNGIATPIFQSPQTVTFIAGTPVPTTPPGVSGTILTIKQDNAVADGGHVDSVKAHITDIYGNPVPAGTSVTFFITTGGTITPGLAKLQNGLQTITLTTGANGDVAVGIYSTMVGTAAVGASIIYNGVATTINQSPQIVNFVGIPVPVTPPGISGTILTIKLDNQPVDGAQGDSVRAYITDISGNPIGSGVAVTFTIQSGGTVTAGAATLQGGGQTVTLTTNSSGYVVVGVRSTMVGTVVVGATIIYNGVATAIYQSPQTVTFIAGTPVPTTPPGVSGTILSIKLDNQAVDGTQGDSVKAHITDIYGNPIPAGTQVTFTILPGGTVTAGVATLQGGGQTVTLTTGANGDVVVGVRSSMAGTVAIGATIVYNGVATAINQSPQTVTFVAGTPVPVTPPGVVNGTVLTIKLDNQTAGGSPTDSVKAHITDINGNPVVAGTLVTFTIQAGGTVSAGVAKFPNGLQTITLPTGVNGDVVAGINSTMVGTVVVGASIIYNGVATAINQSPQTVTFVTGVPVPTAPPGVSGTVLTIKLNYQPVDGAQGDSVRAYITDANGNPVAGVMVTFSITGGTITAGVAQMQGGFPSITVPTGPNGEVTVGINSTMAGTAAVNATIIYNGVARTIFQSPQTVTFVAGTPVPTTPPGVTNGTVLTVKLDDQPAGGTPTDSVTAHITDIYGNPVAAGTQVTFTIQAGGTVTPGIAKLQNGLQTITLTTGANGNATVGINSTMVGTVIVGATIIYNGVATVINQSPQTVTFITNTPVPVTPPGVSGTVLTIKLDNQVVGGAPTDSVKAYITDINGNPAPAGTMVTFTIQPGGTITAGVAQLQNGAQTITLPTDANGVVVVGINSTMSGTAVIGATIVYNGVATAINQSPQTVTFKPSTAVPVTPPGVTNGTVLTIKLDNQPIDGTQGDSVRAYITDQYGNPVGAGTQVTFTIQPGGTVTAGAATLQGGGQTVTLTTGADGSVVAGIHSTMVGTAVVGATIIYNGVVTAINQSPQTVTFIAGTPVPVTPPGVSGTVLTIKLDNQVAGGTPTDSVKAYITDISGNPVVAGTLVTFTIQPGGTVTAGTATLQGGGQTITLPTDAHGVVVVGVNSTMAGTVAVGASIIYNGVATAINQSPQTVTFVAGVPVPTAPPSVNGTVLTIKLNYQPVDGAQGDSVRAYITDINGNPVAAGVPVTFYITTGGTITAGVATLQGGVQTITLPTGPGGYVVVGVNSTMTGTVAVGATILYNGVNTAIFQSPQLVTFIAGTPVPVTPPGVINGTVLAIKLDNQSAGGTPTDSVIAHITDIDGNPVPAGTQVTFTIQPGGTVTAGAASLQGGVQTITLPVTGTDGDVVVGINSTKVGTVIVGATIIYNGVATAINQSPQTVTFIAGVPVPVTPPGVSGTVLTIKLDNQVVGGAPTDSVKAYITDINGNPAAAGTLVTFTIQPGGTITAGVAQLQTGVQTITLPTDANGVVVVGINSTMSGTAVVGATIVYNGVATAINQSARTVTFIAGPAVPVTPPGVTNGTVLTIKLDNQPIDGTQGDSVRAYITDQYGNPVGAGTQVTFTIQPGGTVTAGAATLQGGGQTVTLTTGADGSVVAGIHSTMVGTAVVGATIIYNGVVTAINQSPQTVTFVAGTPVPVTPPGVSGTVLTIKLDNQVAGGTPTDSVKAYITDINGNPAVAGTLVTFFITTGGTVTAGTATLQGGGQTITLPTDAHGVVVVGVNSTMAGTVAVGASIIYNGTATAINQSAQTVTFIAGPAVPVTPPGVNNGTVLTIKLDDQPIDGVQGDSVRAHITDINGNPVAAGVPVTFFITTGGTITAGAATLQGGGQTVTATTGANGDVVIGIHSTLVGTVAVGATIVYNGVATAINQSPQIVTFVAGTPVPVTPPGVNGTILTIKLDNQPVDGAQGDSVKAYITDISGNPVVPGTLVTFFITTGGTVSAGAATLQNGGQTITLPVTGNNGEVVVGIRSTMPGTVAVGASIIYNGTATAINQSAQTVTFKAGTAVPVTPPGINGTILTIKLDNQPVDGAQGDSVRAHITDIDGNPVGAGVPVTFLITTGGTVSAGKATLQGGVQTVTLPTGANGEVVVGINSTMVGTVAVGATIVYNGTATAIYQSPRLVTFTVGTPVPATPAGVDGTILTIQLDNQVVSGVQGDSVKAHITDIYGNPVAAGVPVTFTILTGGTVAVGVATLQGGVQTVTLLTGPNGEVVAGINSTATGTVIVGATIQYNGVATAINQSPQTVTFINAPDVNNPQTALVVVVYEALANGLGNTVVKAHIVDPNGDPVANQEVVFAIDSGNAQIITQGPWMTDDNGDVSISLMSKTPGYVLITATVGGKAIIHGSPARVKFAAINIYVPRVFTPNGDGTNDVLKPILVGISDFHYFSVYNRWGNLIFTTQDANQGWDGRFNGVPQPVETYLWIAEGIDTQGNKVVQKGMVSLVR